jgi:hypothetical protein
MTAGGDLALVYSATGRSNLAIVVDPAVAKAIKLRNRFLLFLGEWFLDTRIGVPYFQFLFVKNPDVALVRRMLRRVIESVGFLVASLDLAYDPSKRTLMFTFSATDGPRVIEGGSGVPFIVDGKGIDAPSATSNVVG